MKVAKIKNHDGDNETYFQGLTGLDFRDFSTIVTIIMTAVFTKHFHGLEVIYVNLLVIYVNLHYYLS